MNLYEPLPSQAAFHQSRSKYRILRGSNRGGKTLGAAIEVARAVTGRDAHGKFPKENGRCYAIGKDLEHVGEVMWWKLAKPGAFKIIKDSQSGKWRAYRPWDPADKLREKEARDAPPLIPRRYIKSIAWENKAKNIPKKISFKNGWQLNFYSSEGKPRRGPDLDLVWMDEEILDEDWLPEMAARLMDRKGRLIWGATPQTGSERLLELSERAERELGSPAPEVEEFLALLSDNPHLDAAEKQSLINILTSEQDVATRIHGEFAQHARKMFPEFNLKTHGCEFFNIPPEWTRYVVVDPGRQVCAVLFGVVSPPERHGSILYLYDELYIKNCSAAIFGERMTARASGQSFETFIIDPHGGALTDIGSGRNVQQQYSEQLRKGKIRSHRSGYGFTSGSDNILGRLEEARTLLRLREDGEPGVKVFWQKLPNFLEEIRKYRHKMVGKVVQDVPEDRGPVHLMQCFQYLAAHRPRFVERRNGQLTSPALDEYRKKQKRMRDKNGPPRILLGPGQWKGDRR